MKTSYLKKSIAMLITLVLIIGLIPTSVYAADENSEATPAGYIYVCMEKATIGQGYLIEPQKVPFYKSEDGTARLSTVMMDFFKDNGYEVAAGSEDTFYLAKINDSKGSRKAEFPQYVIDGAKTVLPDGDELENERNSSFLGEKDYCGLSGWVFKYDNVHSPVGANGVEVTDGSVVRWAYTVVGYGRDCWNTGWGDLIAPYDTNRDALVATMGEFNSRADRKALMRDKKVKIAYNTLAKIGKDYSVTQEVIDNNIKVFEDAVSKAEVNPPQDNVRIFGSDRYVTSLKAADMLKKEMSVDKFNNIVIAEGSNYPDALTGCYLAGVKEAPVLLIDNREPNKALEYIDANLVKEGTVYILGGKGVISDSLKTTIKNKGFNVERLGGRDRYETNLQILKAAGAGNEDLLISTGKGFADSLSASATSKPILLIDDGIRANQKTYLKENNFNDIYILGGKGVVSDRYMSELKPYSSTGIVERVSGANRYATSVAIAEKFFNNPESIVFAGAMDFPDGLSGGPLAMQVGGPMLLVSNNNVEESQKYGEILTFRRPFTLGGERLISNNAIDSIIE